MSKNENKSETHIVESKNQSGGITAHTVTVNNFDQVVNALVSQRLTAKIIEIIFVLAAIVAILTFIFDKPWRPKMNENDNKKEIHIVKSENQSGGITAHTVNVNKQRAISHKYQYKKERRGEDFVLQIILNQTQGIWNSGEQFILQVKISGPYKAANFVGGMPMGFQDVRMSGEGDKMNGIFYFSTTTAPLNNESIVLEIVSASDVNVVEVGMSPLANDE
ncbi:MAG: hypothetical protein NT014_06475 [Candidatus Omnitrophica bacterium]|nr:hypothetical protein [Candidatus Omnitrophota bacterium]